VLLHVSSSEMIDVLSNHALLNFVGPIFLCLSQVFVDLLQERCELAVPNDKFEAIFFNNLFLFFD
jgi:hypothetical protein